MIDMQLCSFTPLYDNPESLIIHWNIITKDEYREPIRKALVTYFVLILYFDIPF